MKFYQRLLSVILLLSLVFSFSSGYAAADGHNWYEIFVRSYRDSDEDGIGDLRGVEYALPYLASLGIDGIWLMPIMPSPSYHKYDVTDYYAVDPEYGTLEDLRSLLAAAHELGITSINEIAFPALLTSGLKLDYFPFYIPPIIPVAVLIAGIIIWLRRRNK